MGKSKYIRMTEIILLPNNGKGTPALTSWPIENLRHGARYAVRVSRGVTTSIHRIDSCVAVGKDSEGRERYEIVESETPMTPEELTFVAACMTADVGATMIRGPRNCLIPVGLAAFLKETDAFPEAPPVAAAA